MTELPTVEAVSWKKAARIIRSVYPPIDLFEDIADPEDWPAIIAAEQKTNPRLIETIGEIDSVEPSRRVGGPGASYLMAPFTHVSADKQGRFSDGTFGVLYVGKTYEVALFETVHHHAKFMASTNEPEGWTAQFREIVLDVDAELHRLDPVSHAPLLMADSYVESQAFAVLAKRAGSNGLLYPSARLPEGQCVALFYPDCASNPVQGRHLEYHWNGDSVDMIKDCGSGQVFRLEA